MHFRIFRIRFSFSQTEEGNSRYLPETRDFLSACTGLAPKKAQDKSCIGDILCNFWFFLRSTAFCEIRQAKDCDNHLQTGKYQDLPARKVLQDCGLNESTIGNCLKSSSATSSFHLPNRRERNVLGLKSISKKSLAASKSIITLSRERLAQRFSGSSFINRSASQFSPAI